MNCFSAFTVETYRGWQAWMRFPRDGMSRPVLCKGQKPKLFKSEKKALEEIRIRLLDYLNGEYRRDGEILSPVKIAAERLFQKVKHDKEERRS